MHIVTNNSKFVHADMKNIVRHFGGKPQKFAWMWESEMFDYSGCMSDMEIAVTALCDAEAVVVNISDQKLHELGLFKIAGTKFLDTMHLCFVME